MSESKTPADKDQKPADASEAELPEKRGGQWMRCARE